MTTAPQDPAAEDPDEPASRLTGARAIPLLLASRTFEQAALGAITLLLAARLSVSAFAPVSVVLIVNSLAVAISDFGLGLGILRCPPGETVASASLHRVRRTNLVVGLIAVAAGFAAGGTLRTVLMGAGVIWGTSAEAYVRKNAALRLAHVRQVFAAEIVSSSAVVAIVATFAHDDRALAVTTTALIVKHVVEVFVVRGWRTIFTPDGRRAPLGALWLALAVNYSVSNVDFVIAGFLGSRAFAVYVLGFRAASAMPAQLANVASRAVLIDIAATDPGSAERQRAYERYVSRLFAIGIVGAAATAALAPLLPVVLGHRWEPAVGVVVVLSIATPWRMILGPAGALAMTGDKVARFVRWELAQLACTAAVLAAGAALGFSWFATASAVASIITVLGMHRLATRADSLQLARWLIVLAPVSLVLAVLGGRLISTSV